MMEKFFLMVDDYIQDKAIGIAGILKNLTILKY